MAKATKTETNPAPVFASIPLKNINPDPNQPRKHFNEEELNELADSIKKHGVLQPIIVRPSSGFNAKKPSYTIVFGERRYRASVIAGMKEINASIRDISDDEALELQIIENLQRKDVHPMEEARAFRYLYDHGKTIEDIAGKVGKGVKYVAARIKLTDLIAEFQEAYLNDMMDYSQAKVICRHSEETQKSLFDDRVRYADSDDEDDEDDEDDDEMQNEPSKSFVVNGKTVDALHLGNISYSLQEFEHRLDTAVFNLNDETLNPSMGICTTCKHNSNNSPTLFLDQAATCNNAACFAIKSNAIYRFSLTEAAGDPNVVFVYNGWGKPYGKERELIDLAKELGLTVYDREDFTEAPEDPGPAPVWESYLEEQKKNYGEGWDDEEVLDDIKSDFDTDMEDWEEAKKEFDEFDTSNCISAFVVAGSDKGKYINIIFKGKVSEKTEGAIAANTSAQISVITEREKRAKELDAEKIQAQVNNLLLNNEDFLNNNTPLSHEESCALMLVLMKTAGCKDNNNLRSQFGITGSDYQDFKLYNEMSKGLIQGTINSFIRKCIANSLISQNLLDHTRLGAPAAILNIARKYIPDNVSIIEKEQQEKAAKRQANVKKKIAALKTASDENGK